MNLGAFAIILAVLLVAYNGGVAATRIGSGTLVALNAAATLLLLAAGAGVELSPEAMGLGTPQLGRGLLWGLGLAAAVVAGLEVAVRTPSLARLLRDERLTGLRGRPLAFRLGIRIPIATALFEEVAFRGVLLAAATAAWGQMAGVTLSSLVFGVWHVAPALDRSFANRPGASRSDRALEVGGTVTVTAVGGVLFALLRIGTGSILAGVIAHAAVNVAATLAAIRTARRYDAPARRST